jgi:hypothetical protein
MKTFCKTIIITLFLFFFTNGLQAQTTQTKLNQVELLKQWKGYWKAEIGKDTVFIMDCKSFHDGLDTYIKIETKGKIIGEKRTLMGYDKKNDKCIEAIIDDTKPELVIFECWHTSPNKMIEVYLEDIANLENAKNIWTFELKSPDLFIWTYLVNNKVISIWTFHRQK